MFHPFSTINLSQATSLTWQPRSLGAGLSNWWNWCHSSRLRFMAPFLDLQFLVPFLGTLWLFNIAMENPHFQ
jgi:hypothetical protein